MERHHPIKPIVRSRLLAPVGEESIGTIRPQSHDPDLYSFRDHRCVAHVAVWTVVATGWGRLKIHIVGDQACIPTALVADPHAEDGPALNHAVGDLQTITRDPLDAFSTAFQ